jgi:hypothetical protein
MQQCSSLKKKIDSSILQSNQMKWKWYDTTIYKNPKHSNNIWSNLIWWWFYKKIKTRLKSFLWLKLEQRGISILIQINSEENKDKFENQWWIKHTFYLIVIIRWASVRYAIIFGPQKSWRINIISSCWGFKNYLLNLYFRNKYICFHFLSVGMV